MTNAQNPEPMLLEAISTGEIVTIVYRGGHAPGTKRRLIPVDVRDGLLRARDVSGDLTKSYRLDLVDICADDAPFPWMPPANQRSKAEKIDPEQLFSTWAYGIHRSFWSALGVTLREYVDKEATKRARDNALAEGLPIAHTSRIQIRQSRYVRMTTPAYDFHEGDIFYARSDGHGVQVVRIREKQMEVHRARVGQRGRNAYHLTPEELAQWLRSGQSPESSRISRAQSQSEVLRFEINDPTPDLG